MCCIRKEDQVIRLRLALLGGHSTVAEKCPSKAQAEFLLLI